MGRTVSWADRTFNDRTRAKGVLALALLLAAAILLGLLLAALPGALAEVLVAAVLLAQRSLADHVQAVARALRLSLPEGRHAVSMIVGRDTATMDEAATARAAIESAAENFSDGVVAPAFWFAVAGLPGLLAYKLVNTADSMIGHRTPRHEAFGWAAARLDDLLNLIPARLSALLIWLTRPRGRWPEIIADARLHRSPNAGWPEAAMARVLDVALSGPRSYHGEMRSYPWVHPQGRKAIGAPDIEASVRTLWAAWAILVALAVLLAAM
jgi:adenosylcobinamide-phosphate synthase